MRKLLILALMLFTFGHTMSGQEEFDKTSFFDKFVIDKTRLSDIPEIQIEKKKTLDKFVSCLYITTESDNKEIGCKPDYVRITFYENSDNIYVLGNISIYCPFYLKLEKVYKTDKESKNKMLNQAQMLASGFYTTMTRRDTPAKEANVVVPVGTDVDSFIRYNVWQTAGYNAVVEALYTNWLLKEKYKDIRWSWSEDGEIVAMVCLDIVGHTFDEEFLKINPNFGNASFQFLEEGDIDDHFDKEVSDRLSAILADAANNKMEETPLKSTLRNDESYIPEGLSVASREALQKYSWQSVRIKNKEIEPEHAFTLTFTFAEDNEDYNSYMNISGQGWSSYRYFKLSENSVRMDIDVSPREVSMAIDNEDYKMLELFETFLASNREDTSLFLDKENNLLFIDTENEGHRSVFKSIERKEE